jgi:DNA modification methylase
MDTGPMIKREVVIGDCRLLLGDSTLIVPTLSGIACTVTSPPYNQMTNVKNPTGIWGDKSCGKGFVENWVANGYADDVGEPEYQRQQIELFDAIAAVSLSNASLFYNHQIRWRDGIALHPVAWFTPSNWNLRSEIIWNRGGGMMFNARMFCRFDERIIWFVRGKEWMWNQDHVGLGTIWNIPRDQNKEHPVAYPVDIPLRCIGATTNPGDVVLDPYSGSASTGIACVRLGRRYIGIEREEKYFDIAVRRITDAYNRPDMFIETARVPEPTQEALSL